MQKGDKYNKLTIIEDYIRKDSHYRKYWKCQCECGNIIEVRGDHLKSGHTKSCGCLNKSRISDISNQRFGKITVLKPTEKRASSGDVIWECICDCGNTVYATKSELVSKRKISCGCIRSNGEQIIASILLKNNICYKKEYVFSDLKDEGYLRFDFGILDNEDNLLYLIEYDGEFHFGKHRGWNKEIDSKKIQYHDELKNEYCKKNNIPLIRIPYTHLEQLKLEDLLLSTSNYLIPGVDDFSKVSENN